MRMLLTKNDIALLGVAMGLTGHYYGMYFNYLLPVFHQWTSIFMVLSILCLLNWRNLLSLRINHWNELLAVVFIFQLIMLLYASFSDNITIQLFSFHLYVVVFIISIATTSHKLNFDRLPLIVFIITVPLLIMGAVLTYLGVVSGELNYQLRLQDADFPIEPFSVANGALTNFFACLSMKRKRFLDRWILGLATIMAFYVIMSCTKRTPVFVLICGVLFYLWNKGKETLKSSKEAIGYIFCVFSLLILCYFCIDFVYEKVNSFGSDFSRGVLALFGDRKVDPTGSVTIRVENRNWALNYIDSNFSLLNYIGGAGYFVRWLDFPILEAFLDMGIIGFLFYLYIIVLYPINRIRKHVDKDVVIFVSLICLYAIASIANSGHPYQWNKYIPVCLFSVVWEQYKRFQYAKKSICYSDDS